MLILKNIRATQYKSKYVNKLTYCRKTKKTIKNRILLKKNKSVRNIFKDV